MSAGTDRLWLRNDTATRRTGGLKKKILRDKPKTLNKP